MEIVWSTVGPTLLEVQWILTFHNSFMFPWFVSRPFL